MQKTRTLPIMFLALLAGCAEQPPVVADAPISVVNQADEKPTKDVDTETATQTLYKVIKTVDGDTIDVLTDDNETIRLRFNGIDTPERGQPFGNNATKFVSETVGGKMVRLVTHGKDKAIPTKSIRHACRKDTAVT